MPVSYIGPAPVAPNDIVRQSDVTDALGSQVHSAADITSGTLADARISASSVTQHQAALAITEAQISDLGTYATTAQLAGATYDAAAITSGTFASARIAQASVTQHQAALAVAASQVTSGTFASARIAQASVTQHQAALAIASSQVTSGTLANARISASSVTQHQAALTITTSQISNISTYDTVASVDTKVAAQGFAVDRTGAAYTMLAADIGRTVLVNAAVTLPALTSASLRARIDLVNTSGSNITPAVAANVTRVGATLIEPNAAASFILTATNGTTATWLMIGGRA